MLPQIHHHLSGVILPPSQSVSTNERRKPLNFEASTVPITTEVGALDPIYAQSFDHNFGSLSDSASEYRSPKQSAKNSTSSLFDTSTNQKRINAAPSINPYVLENTRQLSASGSADSTISPLNTQVPYSRESMFVNQIDPKSKLSIKLNHKIKNTCFDMTMNSTINDIRNFRKSLLTPSVSLQIRADESNEQERNNSINQKYVIFDNNNPFLMQCNDVVVSLAELETNMQSFAFWRDNFLKQEGGFSSLKLTLALLASRITRAQSDLSQLVLELVRTVRIYSDNWNEKHHLMSTLEHEHDRQTRAFDIAIRKIELMHGQITQRKANRLVFMWEYITRKLVRREQKSKKLVSNDIVSYGQDVAFEPAETIYNKIQVKNSKHHNNGPVKRNASFTKIDTNEGKLRQFYKENIGAKYFVAGGPSAKLQIFIKNVKLHHPCLEAVMINAKQEHHFRMYHAHKVLELSSPLAKGILFSHCYPHSWMFEDATELSKKMAAAEYGLKRTISTSDILQYHTPSSGDFRPTDEPYSITKAPESSAVNASKLYSSQLRHHSENLPIPIAPLGMQEKIVNSGINLNKSLFTRGDVLDVPLLNEQQQQQVNYPRDQFEKPAPNQTSVSITCNVQTPDDNNLSKRRKSFLLANKPQVTDAKSSNPDEGIGKRADKPGHTRRMEENLTRVVCNHHQITSEEDVIGTMNRVLPAVFMPSNGQDIYDRAFPSRSTSRASNRSRPSSRPAGYVDNSTNKLDLIQLSQALIPKPRSPRLKKFHQD